MSLKATRYALVAARQLRADIHLLHVVETNQFISPSLLSLSSVAGEEWNDHWQNDSDGSPPHTKRAVRCMC